MSRKREYREQAVAKRTPIDFLTKRREHLARSGRNSVQHAAKRGSWPVVHCDDFEPLPPAA